MKKILIFVSLILTFIIGCEKGNLNIEELESQYKNIEFKATPQPNETCNVIYLDAALIVNEINAAIGLSDDQINWLNCRQLESEQIRDFLNDSSLDYSGKKDVVDAQLFLLMTDVDYYLINKEFVTLPAWMWPILKEIAIEIVVEIIQKQFPGGVVEDFIELAQGVQQGDLIQVVGELIDIGKNFFPGLKIISAIWDGTISIVKETKAFRAFEKMRELGDEIINNLGVVIRNQAGSIFDKFKWANNRSGIELSDIDDPFAFWDDFQFLFPNAEILDPEDLQAWELAGFKLNGGQIRITIKYGGNTNPDGFTMEFSKGSLTRKIRFV